MSRSDSKAGSVNLERSCSSVSASSTTSSRRSARRKRKRIKHTVMPLKKRPGRHDTPCDVHRISNLDHEEMYQSACFWVAKNPEEKDRSFKEEVFVNRNDDLMDESGSYLEHNMIEKTRETQEVFSAEERPDDTTYSEEKMFYGVRKAGVTDGGNVERFSPLPSPRNDSRMSSISDETRSAISSDGAGMRVGWTSDINNSSGPEYSGITDEDSDDEREPRRIRRDIRSVNDKWRENMRPRDNKVVVARDVSSFESREKQDLSSENSSVDRDYRAGENPPPYNGRATSPSMAMQNGHIYPGENIPGPQYPGYTAPDGYQRKPGDDRNQPDDDDGVFYPDNNTRGSPVFRNRTPSPIDGPSRRVQRKNEENAQFVTSTVEQSSYTAPAGGDVQAGPYAGGRTSTPTRHFTSSDTELLHGGNDVEDDQLSHRSLPMLNKRTNTKYYSVEELRKSTEEAKSSDVTQPPYVPRLSDAYMRYQPPRRVRPRNDDPTVRKGREERDGSPMDRHEEPKVLATSYETVKHRSKMLVPGYEATTGDEKENLNPNEDTHWKKDSDGYHRNKQDQDESYSYSYSSVKDFSDKPRSRAPLRGGKGPREHPMRYPGDDRDMDVQPGEAYVVEQPGEQNKSWEESKEFYGYRRNNVDDPNYSYATPNYPGGKPKSSRDPGNEVPGGELIGKAEVQQTFSTNDEHRLDDGRWKESKEFYGYRRLQNDGSKYQKPGETVEDDEKDGEKFVGVKQQKITSGEDQSSTEQTQEFYGYRRIHGDNVYSHLTPPYKGQPAHDQDLEKDTRRLQRDQYEESKEFYGYPRQYVDDGPVQHAGDDDQQRNGDGAERMVTSSGYEMITKQEMVSKSQTYHHERTSRTDERTPYMNGTSYSRDSILTNPSEEGPRRKTLPPLSSSPSGAGESTTKRLHTRSERDTLRREGRYRPEMKPTDNDVGMKMFRQRSLPRKHSHPAITERDEEVQKKSKSDQQELSDPEFAEKFRQITEKRKQNTATKTTTTTQTTKTSETSRRNAAESCNKNVDELVSVFNTLENLQQQQPGTKKDRTIPPGQVKKIVKEGRLNTALREGRKISPATSVSQKLKEIENILDSVDKNNQQRLRTSERGAHERQLPQHDNFPNNRPWSRTDDYSKGALSEGELYVDEIYTTEEQTTSEVYRGSPRRGRTRRRRYHDSRAYSDGEIEEFRRPYYQKRTITPGTPVYIRLYGLNLEKTQQDRSYDIDWGMLRDVQEPVNENVERSERPQQVQDFENEPVLQQMNRNQLPWQRQHDIPDRNQAASYDNRERIQREVILKSVKRETTKSQDTVKGTSKTPPPKRPADSHKPECEFSTPPVKRPTDSYAPEDEPPEKRYTNNERTSGVEPPEVVPMEEAPELKEVKQSPGEDVCGDKARYPGKDRRKDDYIEVEVEHMDEGDGDVPPGKRTATPRRSSPRKVSPQRNQSYWEEHDESFDESHTRVQSSSSDKNESNTRMEHTTRTTKTTHTTTETTVKKVTSSRDKSSSTDIVTRTDKDRVEEPEEEVTSRADEQQAVAHEYLEMNADTGRPVNLTMLGRVMEDDNVDLTSPSKEDVFLHTRLKMVTEQKQRSEKLTKQDVETSLRKSSDDDVDNEGELTDSENDIEQEAMVSEAPMIIPMSREPVEESFKKTEKKQARPFLPEEISYEDGAPVKEHIHKAMLGREKLTNETFEKMFNPPFVLELDIEKQDVPKKKLPNFQWVPEPGDEVNENVEFEQTPTRDLDLPDFSEFEEETGIKIEVDEHVTADPVVPRIESISSSLIENLEEKRDVVHEEEMQRDTIVAAKLPEFPQLQGELIRETFISEKREVQYELPELEPNKPTELVIETIDALEPINDEVLVPDIQELLPEPKTLSPVDEIILQPEKVSKDDVIPDFQEVVPEFQAQKPRSAIDEVVSRSNKPEKPDLPELDTEFPIEDNVLDLQEAVQEPPRPPVVMETDADSGEVNIKVVPDSCRDKPSEPTEYYEVPKKIPVPERQCVENETVTETHTTKTVTIEKTFTKDVHYVSDIPQSKGRPLSPHVASDAESSSEVSMHSSGYADVSSEAGDVTGDVDETDFPPTARRRRSRRGNRFDDIRRSGHLVPVSVVTQSQEPESVEETFVPVETIPVETVALSDQPKQSVETPLLKFGRPSKWTPDMYLMSSDDEGREGEQRVVTEQPKADEDRKVMKAEMEPWKCLDEEPKEMVEEVCQETMKEDKDLDLMENENELSQEAIDELLEKEVERLPKDDESPNQPEEICEKVPIGEKIRQDMIEPVELEPSEIMEDVEKVESVKDLPEVEYELMDQNEEVEICVEKESEDEDEVKEMEEEIEKEIPIEIDLAEKIPEEEPRKIDDVIKVGQKPDYEDDVTEKQHASPDNPVAEQDRSLTKSTVETIIVEKTHSEISTTVTEISTKKVSNDRTVSSSEDETDFVHIRVNVDNEPKKLRDVPISGENDAMEPENDLAKPREDLAGSCLINVPQEDVESLAEEKAEEILSEEIDERVPVGEMFGEHKIDQVEVEVIEDVEKDHNERKRDLPDMEYEVTEEVETWFGKEERSEDEQEEEISEDIEKEIPVEVDLAEKIPEKEPSKDEIPGYEDVEKESGPDEVPVDINNDVAVKNLTSSDVTLVQKDNTLTQSTVETIIVEKTHSEISTTVTEISTKKVSNDRTVSSSEDETDFVHIRVDVDNEPKKLREVPISGENDVSEPDVEVMGTYNEPKDEINDDIDIPVQLETVEALDDKESCKTSPTDIIEDEVVCEEPGETVFAILDINYETPQTTGSDVYVEGLVPIDDNKPLVYVTRASSESSGSESDDSESSMSSDEAPVPDDVTTPEIVPEGVMKAENVPVTEGAPSGEDVVSGKDIKRVDLREFENEPEFEDDRGTTSECQVQTETNMWNETTQTEITTTMTRETMTKDESCGGEQHESEMQTEMTQSNDAASQTNFEETEEVTSSSETKVKTSEKTTRYYEESRREGQKVSQHDGSTQTDVYVSNVGSGSPERKTSEMSCMTEAVAETLMNSEGTQTELRDDEGHMDQVKITRITRKTTTETDREYSETTSKDSWRKEFRSDCPVCLQTLESSQYSYIKVSDLSKYTAMSDFSSQTTHCKTSTEEYEYCFACGRHTSEELRRETSEERSEERRRNIGETSEEHRRDIGETSEQWRERSEERRVTNVDKCEEEVTTETTVEGSHFAIQVIGDEKCSLYCRRIGNHECMLQKLASIIEANRKATTASADEGGLGESEITVETEGGATAVIGREYRDVSIQTEGAILPTDFEVFNEKDFEIYYDEERYPTWFV